MSQNKKIAINSLILYIRLFITTIIGLLTTRLIIKYLGVSDFGLYSVVGSVVGMIGFINVVMVSTTYRYIAFEMGRKGVNSVNKIFNISLIIHIMIALVVIMLAETFGVWYIHNKLNLESNKLSDAIFIFRFSIIATIFNIISIPYQGLITALEKFSIRASIEIIRSILGLFSVISLMYYFDNKLRAYATMMSLLTLLTSSLFIIYCRRYYKINVIWHLQRNIKKYKEMLAYSIWTMIGAAAQIGKTIGSQLIINLFFGTLLNAAFGVANQVNKFVMLFSQNIGQAAVPQIIKSHSSGDTKRTFRLVAYVNKYTFFLIFLPSLPILLETEYLLDLWMDEIPDYTVSFCKLMLINGLIDSLRSGIPAAIQATGKIKWFQIINGTIMLSSLPIAYTLFKFGLPPAAIQISYISTAIITTIINLILLKKIINFDVNYLLQKSYLRITFVFLSTVPFFYLINLYQPGLPRFVSFSASSLIWLIGMIYLVGLEKTEKDQLRMQIIKFKKRK